MVWSIKSLDYLQREEDEDKDLVEEEVGAPGGARSEHVGSDAPVEAAESLGLDYGGHRVTDI